LFRAADGPTILLSEIVAETIGIDQMSPVPLGPEGTSVFLKRACSVFTQQASCRREHFHDLVKSFIDQALGLLFESGFVDLFQNTSCILIKVKSFQSRYSIPEKIRSQCSICQQPSQSSR